MKAAAFLKARSVRAASELSLFKHYAVRPSGIRFDLHKISLELTQDQYGRLGNGSTFFHLRLASVVVTVIQGFGRLEFLNCFKILVRKENWRAYLVSNLK